MIKRLVKMVFREEAVPDFLDIFEASCERIRAFEGCEYLELVRDERSPGVLFTISIWESEDALESYRHSELFRSTWKATKALFADKPQAWSTRSQRVLD